jgi:hypothetical protein
LSNKLLWALISIITSVMITEVRMPTSKRWTKK